MKTIYIKITAITLMMSSMGNLIFSQDVLNSQPYSTPLMINPALMNLNDDFNVTLNYRNQWGILSKGYTTSTLSVMYPIFLNDGKQKLDLGLNIRSNVFGAFNNLNLNLALAYGLKISKSSSLSLALSGSYMQQSLNVNGLTFDDQYVLGTYSSNNPTNQAIVNKKYSYPDVNTGLIWNIRPEESNISAYAGLSVFHLTQPKATFTSQNGVIFRRVSSQAGIKITGENKIDITPNVIVSSQGGVQRFATGVYLDYRANDDLKLTFGSWYRKNSAIAFVVKLNYKVFQFGYSYDMPYSNMGNTINGLNTHEISLSYKLNKNKGVKLPSLL